jgi:hypothetical protein
VGHLAFRRNYDPVHGHLPDLPQHVRSGQDRPPSGVLHRICRQRAHTLRHQRPLDALASEPKLPDRSPLEMLQRAGVGSAL